MTGVFTNTEAIVLRRRDYREADSIVTFFTRDNGKVSGIGFGAKRSRVRFANCLDVFCTSHVEFVVQANRDLVRIERCRLLDARPNLRRDEKTLAYAAYLVDLVSNVTVDDDANPGVYMLLDAALGWLDDGRHGGQIARIFEVRLLGLVGYEFNLETCTKCGAVFDPAEVFGFSASQGGIVCKNCDQRDRVPISPGTVKALRFAQTENIESVVRLKFSSRNLREAKSILNGFIVGMLHRRLRTMNYVDRIEREESP